MDAAAGSHALSHGKVWSGGLDRQPNSVGDHCFGVLGETVPSGVRRERRDRGASPMPSHFTDSQRDEVVATGFAEEKFFRDCSEVGRFQEDLIQRIETFRDLSSVIRWNC